jgi:hypothetical protein
VGHLLHRPFLEGHQEGEEDDDWGEEQGGGLVETLRMGKIVMVRMDDGKKGSIL